MALSAFFVALAATFLVATLARKSISFFRAALNSERIAAQTANCFLLSICLLVTWIVVLQSCVDVGKGGGVGRIAECFCILCCVGFSLV